MHHQLLDLGLMSSEYACIPIEDPHTISKHLRMIDAMYELRPIYILRRFLV